jgi:UPF0755 protein
MKKLLAAAIVFILLFVLVAGFLFVRDELTTPFPMPADNVVIEIPRGLRAREIVGLLESRRVISNRYVTLAYIFYSGRRNRLLAGEYVFDRPMTPIEVVDRITSGNVRLYKFTVAEGLTIDDTAAKWEEQGYGKAAEFLLAANESTSLIKDIDPNARSLEGYLFPETYSFPRRTTAKQIVESMVSRFRGIVQKLENEVPKEQWPLGLRETVILASLVESEAARAEDRPLVAGVYTNRLSRKMLLQCDPTVIYALQKAQKYRGRLLLVDLKFPSPYNTYVTPGLPPGPIMNPGYAALRAAVQPAVSKNLFFVRTVDGRHTFSETLAAHNKAVAAYRALQRQAKK